MISTTHRMASSWFAGNASRRRECYPYRSRDAVRVVVCPALIAGLLLTQTGCQPAHAIAAVAGAWAVAGLILLVIGLCLCAGRQTPFVAGEMPEGPVK